MWCFDFRCARCPRDADGSVWADDGWRCDGVERGLATTPLNATAHGADRGGREVSISRA